MMVEAAWNAVRTHPFWKAQFTRLVEGKHLHPTAAAVAIARQLLVVVWHVLSKRQADHQAIPDKVARKFLLWSYRVGRKGRNADCGTFVRLELGRVGIQPPASVRLGSHTIDLTAPELEKDAAAIKGERLYGCATGLSSPRVPRSSPGGSAASASQPTKPSRQRTVGHHLLTPFP